MRLRFIGLSCTSGLDDVADISNLVGQLVKPLRRIEGPFFDLFLMGEFAIYFNYYSI